MKNESITTLLKKFVDGMTKASGAASALVHEHSDPRFIPIYQKLSSVRNKAIDIAMKATGVEVKHVTKH